MKIVKKINDVFVKAILFFVYLFGIGLSFLVRMIVHKPDFNEKSYWVIDGGNTSDEVNKEAY